MTKNNPGVAQSVRQRLLNLAHQTDQDYNRLLVRYALERLLYRISQSTYADRFILKGALLFAVWSRQQYRATQDLDLLGVGDNSPAELDHVFREIAQVSTDVHDGMSYIAETVTTEIIREDMTYEGVRVRMESRLGSARVPLIVDVGFGDAITPAPYEVEFPVLLDAPVPRIRSYPRETVVAEKLEAMVSLGEANSRMKDFADVYHLCMHFYFDGAILTSAIVNTFERRRTPMTSQPIAFTAEFAQLDHKKAQWAAFLRRSSPDHMPADFQAVVEGIAAFLGPILTHTADHGSLPQTWQAGGPWRF